MKKALTIFVFVSLLPSFALASTKYIYLSGSGSWTIPADWLPTNAVEVIGGGGGGAGGDGIAYVEWWAYGSGGAGGGGGYSKISNIVATASSTFYYSVGAGGAAGPWSGNGTSGGDTFFCNSNTSCSALNGSSVIVGAQGGALGTVAPTCGGAMGGYGGQASAGVVTGSNAIKYSGGTGGSEPSVPGCPGAWVGGTGGGGAGGPSGNGGDGAVGTWPGGGGGNGGGSAGNSVVNYSNYTGAAAPGGNNAAGNGGGAAGTAGSPTGVNGSSGGGGGAGNSALSTSGSGMGGTGGTGIEWDATHGSGGGGGGGGAWNEMPGGQGGLYGGGGGGAGAYNGGAWDGGSSGGAGAPGIIVISYTNLPPSTPAVTGPTTGSKNVQYVHTFTSTDPEADPIRYGIDWDHNGSIDEWEPTSGYVPSGTVQSSNHAWDTAGSKTFYVIGQDTNGNTATSSYTIVIGNAAPTVLLTTSIDPARVYRQGDAAVTLTWSSSDANTCTGTNFSTGADSPTSGTAQVTPVATTQYTVTCSGNGNGSDSKTIAYTADQAPTAPSISGPASGSSGTPYMFTFQSTDPESDTLRYGIDWDNNGTVDEWVPAVGYVSSGASQSSTHTWGGLGMTAFEARAQDSRGVNSSWSAHACSTQYVCGANPNQNNIYDSCTGTLVQSCVSPNFCSAGSSVCLSSAPSFTSAGGLTGHLQALPSLLDLGVTTKLFWNVSGVSGCTVTGTNGDHWSGISSGSGGVTSSPIFQQAIFTLSCAGLDSSTVNETQTVNIIPVFQEK